MTSTEEDFLELARHANPKGGTGEDIQHLIERRHIRKLEGTLVQEQRDQSRLDRMTKLMTETPKEGEDA